MPLPMAGQPIVGRVGDVTAELEDWQVNGLEEQTDKEWDTDDDYGGPISALLALLAPPDCNSTPLPQLVP